MDRPFVIFADNHEHVLDQNGKIILDGYFKGVTTLLAFAWTGLSSGPLLPAGRNCYQGRGYFAHAKKHEQNRFSQAPLCIWFYIVVGDSNIMVHSGPGVYIVLTRK
jgi:hypothetical protein